MDPLSVIASITGILTAAVKISRAASSVLSRWTEAPSSIHNLVVEMTALGACVAKLKPYFEKLDSVPRDRTEIISVEQVLVVTSSCALAVSELQKSLETFAAGKTLTVNNKMWWVLNKEKIDASRSRVQASTSSLNLILTVITCSTAEESRISIDKLRKQMDQILQKDTDLASRFANPSGQEISSRYDLSLRETESDAPDDASVVTAKRIDMSEKVTSRRQETMAFGLHPETEYGLMNSAVYMRAVGRHSISSDPSMSVSDSSRGWSFCSYFSLAQVTSISVLSLPISAAELWKPEQYVVQSQNDSQNDVKQPQRQSESRPSLQMLLHPKSSLFKPDYLRALHGFTTENSLLGPKTALDEIIRRTFIRSNIPENFCEFHSINSFQLSRALDNNVWISHLFEARNTVGAQDLSIKTLLLGDSGDGKSTVLQQMFALYRQEPTRVDRLLLAVEIRLNILGIFCYVFMLLKAQGIQYTSPICHKYERMVVEAREKPACKFSPDLCAALKGLWSERCVFHTIIYQEGFPLRSNFSKLLEDIDRVAPVGYLPTADDIFCTYKIDWEITETFFSFRPIHPVTVRRIHVFDPTLVDLMDEIRDTDVVISVLSDPYHRIDDFSPSDKVLGMFLIAVTRPRFSSSRFFLIINAYPTATNQYWRRRWKKRFHAAAEIYGTKLHVFEMDLRDKASMERNLNKIFHVKRPWHYAVRSE